MTYSIPSRCPFSFESSCIFSILDILMFNEIVDSGCKFMLNQVAGRCWMRFHLFRNVMPTYPMTENQGHSQQASRRESLRAISNARAFGFFINQSNLGTGVLEQRAMITDLACRLPCAKYLH